MVQNINIKTVSEYEERPIVMYQGDYAGEKLIDALVQERNRIVKILKNLRKLFSDLKIRNRLMRQQHATSARRFFDKTCDIKVRDHDHISGKYRGAAHHMQLKLSVQKSQQKKPNSFVIPIVFHNLEAMMDIS